jgi:hypothetical protein
MAKKKRKKRKNPDKGGNFEREIAVTLSSWWTNGTNQEVFWRSAGSGGRATRRSRAGKSAKRDTSDLRASDPIGEPFLRLFAPELKNGYFQHPIIQLVDRPRHTLGHTMWDTWIAQAESARKNSGAVAWCVIARRTGQEILFVCPLPILRLLLRLPDRSMVIHYNGEQVGVIRFEDFLDLVSRKKINRLLKDFK